VTFSSLLVLVALTAAPHKLAAPAWTTVNVSPELAGYYAAEVARVLRSQGLEVTSASDITTLLGLERQKQLLGCNDDASSCIAELGAALGCDAIITANLARLDDTYQGSLRVLSTKDGKTLVDQPVRADSQKGLADALEVAALEVARRLAPAAAAPSRRLWWVPLVAGVALGVAGGVSLGVSRSNYALIPSSAEETATRLARDGVGLQTAGFTLVGVGLAAVVSAVVWFALGAEPATVAARLTDALQLAALGLTRGLP
jgi:hypothetical protein